MIFTDAQILSAISLYREEVSNRHGPPSLDALSLYMSVLYREKEISKSALSERINRLVDQNCLIATRDWTCTLCGESNTDTGDGVYICRYCERLSSSVSYRIYTFSLKLTDLGRDVIKENGDGVLERT